MSIERDHRNRNWRLVCHTCGVKYPMNAACKPECCTKPDLHIHNTDKPCVLCEEPMRRCAKCRRTVEGSEATRTTTISELYVCSNFVDCDRASKCQMCQRAFIMEGTT